jgi:hypothetical protein
MKRIEFTCDGCDLVMHADLPSDGRIETVVDGWVAHRVTCHENGVAVREISADLCPGCTEKLRHAINPVNWPRQSASVRQFGRK